MRPRFPDELAATVADLHRLFTSVPAYATLGIRVAGWGPGWSEVAAEPTADLTNLAGTVHGAVTFALADAAFEIACNSLGRLSVALETTVHHHRPVAPGSLLLATGREASRGGRTATYHLEVTADGELVLSGLALAYRTSTWHLGAERWPESWRARH